MPPSLLTEPDPNQHYYISYANSQSWMKEIDFQVSNNSNGTLGTFNGTINDQAGPIIVAAIGTVVQIGGAAATGGVSMALLAETSRPPDRRFCSKEVADGLDEIMPWQQQIETIQNDIKLQPKGATPEQTQTLQIAQSKIDSATKKYNLTRSISLKWVPAANDDFVLNGEYYLLHKTISITHFISEWLCHDPSNNDCNDANMWLNAKLSSKNMADPRRKLKEPFLLTLAVNAYSMGSPSQPVFSDPNDPAAPNGTDGLVIRDPATGTFRACQNTGSACVARTDAPVVNKLIETTDDVNPRIAVTLPQLGRMMILPQHSELFENAVLKATLNSDGTIQMIDYHSSNTLAAGLQGLSTAAANASAAIAARNTAINAVNTAKLSQIQAPDNYNKALADCLTSRATILKAGGTPGPCQ